MRVTEFCELTHDAIVKMNEANWLRLPVGKVHTDRYVPLHPSLIELHRTWRHWAGPDGALVARCITFRHTGGMGRAISVRLDDEAERALRLLESTGLSRSEAIRSSLLASADRMRRRSQLAAEVAALEADDDDRSEMLAVASLMESMRAAG